jgi:hypothetical protein
VAAGCVRAVSCRDYESDLDREQLLEGLLSVFGIYRGARDPNEYPAPPLDDLPIERVERAARPERSRDGLISLRRPAPPAAPTPPDEETRHVADGT